MEKLKKYFPSPFQRCKAYMERNSIIEMGPREYKLYHYTSRREWLQAVLREGFWPRFSAEDFSWMIDKPLYLMVPMVCFCDMPAELSSEHRRAYGQFCIGLSKDWGKRNGLTPVLYVYEDGPVAKLFRQFSRLITKAELKKDDFGATWDLLSYLKPVTGALPGRSNGGHDYTEIKDFDEEMEWRYVPPAFKDSIYTIELYDAQKKEEAQERSESTRGSMLRFKPEDLEVLIVPSDVERRCLVDEFPQYGYKIKTWPEVLAASGCSAT